MHGADTTRTSNPKGSPSFFEAFKFWLKLGFISFGGPTGQIAVMHQELVEKRRWISEERFLHALNYCMLLPGPEAQQLATYVGWLLHKAKGGIVAGSLFVLPSVFILWGLSLIYVTYGQVGWIASGFYGLKPAVLAIVAAAVIRIGSKALKNAVMWSLAAVAFVAIYFFKVPYPLIIISAALIGLVGGKLWKKKFLLLNAQGAHAAGKRSVLDNDTESPDHAKPSWGRAVKVLLACLIAWWGPVVLAAFALGTDHTVFREGVFFSKAAMVTFGGAYAVLPYVSQQAVETHHWLSAPQMLDGLGLAETTPGPLIIVLQFVGFLGGWARPGQLSPLTSATLGALITTWATFAPCFLWIFLGGPHIEQLRGNEKLTTALSAVTAAVVGVILNLAVWFGIHVLFPASGGFDVFSAVVSVAAFVAMIRLKVDMIPVVFAAAFLGICYKTFLPALL